VTAAVLRRKSPDQSRRNFYLRAKGVAPGHVVRPRRTPVFLKRTSRAGVPENSAIFFGISITIRAHPLSGAQAEGFFVSSLLRMPDR
jgi:hypothetical protein